MKSYLSILKDLSGILLTLAPWVCGNSRVGGAFVLVWIPLGGKVRTDAGLPTSLGHSSSFVLSEGDVLRISCA